MSTPATTGEPRRRPSPRPRALDGQPNATPNRQVAVQPTTLLNRVLLYAVVVLLIDAAAALVLVAVDRYGAIAGPVVRYVAVAALALIAIVGPVRAALQRDDRV